MSSNADAGTVQRRSATASRAAPLLRILTVARKEVLDQLYLVTLSRLPSEAERAPALSHVTRGTDKRKAWEDVMWALLNTREFLFRH